MDTPLRQYIISHGKHQALPAFVMWTQFAHRLCRESHSTNRSDPRF
jgi:hypothetical protein